MGVSPPPPRCIEPHSFTHRYGAGGAMGQCCPASAPPPPPRPMGVGVYGAAPPPTLHWTQFSMGQGALWGGSAPLLDPHPTQRGGGGGYGAAPLHSTPALIPIWGKGALWGGAAPLLDPPHPNGGLYGALLPCFWTPPHPNRGLYGAALPRFCPPLILVWGGAETYGAAPPLALNPILYGAVGAMGQCCPTSGPPPSQWGLYGAVLPRFWTPPIPMGGSMGQCCPTSAPRYPGGGVVGRPPPLASNPTLIPIWGSRRYGAAPPPSAPPAMG